MKTEKQLLIESKKIDKKLEHIEKEKEKKHKAKAKITNQKKKKEWDEKIKGRCFEIFYNYYSSAVRDFGFNHLEHKTFVRLKDVEPNKYTNDLCCGKVDIIFVQGKKILYYNNSDILNCKTFNEIKRAVKLTNKNEKDLCNFYKYFDSDLFLEKNELYNFTAVQQIAKKISPFKFEIEPEDFDKKLQEQILSYKLDFKEE